MLILENVGKMHMHFVNCELATSNHTAENASAFW